NRWGKGGLVWGKGDDWISEENIGGLILGEIKWREDRKRWCERIGEKEKCVWLLVFGMVGKWGEWMDMGVGSEMDLEGCKGDKG
ncbi:hypothetical protein, partial [Neisseria sicca]|uniref:hypothetical protein n=1 Tax=Neisseria sicca TaxID=490 RepID=UPI0016498D8E